MWLRRPQSEQGSGQRPGCLTPQFSQSLAGSLQGWETGGGGGGEAGGGGGGEDPVLLYGVGDEGASLSLGSSPFVDTG